MECKGFKIMCIYIYIKELTDCLIAINLKKIWKYSIIMNYYI